MAMVVDPQRKTTELSVPDSLVQQPINRAYRVMIDRPWS